MAARLGFHERTIRRLAAPHLRRLVLTEAQIRARLYHAYLVHLRAHADGETKTERR